MIPYPCSNSTMIYNPLFIKCGKGCLASMICGDNKGKICVSKYWVTYFNCFLDRSLNERQDICKDLNVRLISLYVSSFNTYSFSLIS